MPISGADVPALINFGGQLRQRKRRIEEATKHMQTLVQNANWVGPDRDRFVSDWNTIHAPNLRGVCDNIGHAAKRIATAAAKQKRASAR